MEDKAKNYLGYLEKEMIIMGILSAFCITAATFIFEKVVSAEKGYFACLWLAGAPYFWIASFLMLISSALFYKERSLLAFYYGRISLGTVPIPVKPNEDMNDWVDYADSWTTWIPYNSAFWIGVCALVNYILAIFSKDYTLLRSNAIIFIAITLFILILVLFFLVKVMKDRSML